MLAITIYFYNILSFFMISINKTCLNSPTYPKIYRKI